MEGTEVSLALAISPRNPKVGGVAGVGKAAISMKFVQKPVPSAAPRHPVLSTKLSSYQAAKQLFEHRPHSEFDPRGSRHLMPPPHVACLDVIVFLAQ